MSDKSACKVYVIVSGKGGAGKSTVACGLGGAFAEKGLKTLLIDADEGLRCLDLMLGVAADVLFDTGDVINNRCDLADALKSIPDVPNLFLLPAPAEHGIVGDGFAELTASLRDKFDRIIIDSTAGVGDGFKAAVKSADAAIVVVGSDPVSIRDARGVCQLLDDAGMTARRMIINRYDYKAMRQSLAPHIDKMIDNTALRLIGIVPYDSALTVGAIKGKLAKRGKAKRAFGRIANRLCGKNVRLPKLKRI